MIQNKSVSLIFLCAGKGKRFGSKVEKQFILFKKKPLYWYALKTFSQVSIIKEIVITLPAKKESLVSAQLKKEAAFKKKLDCIQLVQGGKERYLSVYNALQHVNKKTNYVLIHDGARPLIHLKDIKNILRQAYQKKIATIPTEDLNDTIKQVNSLGFIASHPKRHQFKATSTPQCFPLNSLKQAYETFFKQNKINHLPTDDAEIYAFSKKPITTISLVYPNPKITYSKDKRILEACF